MLLFWVWNILEIYNFLKSLEKMILEFFIIMAVFYYNFKYQKNIS